MEIEKLCRELPDPMTLFSRLKPIVTAVVAADGVCGLTLDPATLLHTGGFHDGGVPHSHLPRLLDIEYGEEDVNQFPHLVGSGRLAAGLWESTRLRPSASSRYRDVYRPTGMGDELRVVLRSDRTVWGALVLHRGGDRPPFDAAEIEAMSALAAPLARGLRGAYLRHDALCAEAAEPSAPGLVTFGAEGGIDAVTPSGHAWLDRLGGDPGVLPQPVLHVCSRARAGGDVRVHLRDLAGRPVSLTANRMDPAGRVAVIIEAGRPEHTIGLLMAAYGLTAREQDVAQLVVYGLSDAETARRLGISPHTVRDHLKKVFDKTGTNSRGRLVRLLYFAHYRPAVTTARPMGTHGWFHTPGTPPGSSGPAGV
ncbi:LuxR C-terminal-related transcriptional regulator [Streptomyces bambusae]|uniref:LuxR C-terminal-related transcriptional regulator n=1 Tax=Streptomyces bambusae TaxID=1550616 RepID=UPI001CFF1C10|nr:LuxR C-terminal-related transcriptional regulator [Streptomyces bambusae]MCB5165842.1 LuxR C-terminal-related transcriptional regulator [Streptomyces bambusae]